MSVSARRAEDQRGDENKQRRCAEADGIDQHDGLEGHALRKDELDPRNANAAHAEHRQKRGRERDAEAAQVGREDLVEQAEAIGRQDRCQADIAEVDDLRIAVEDGEQ